jgi:hypothetical protein
MDQRHKSSDDATWRARDARINEAARREILRRDGARDLGENLEQAAALIKAAFELRDSFSAPRR